MPYPAPQSMETIAAYHQLMGLPRPAHPLISLVRFEDMRRRRSPGTLGCAIVNGFYCVALKYSVEATLRYGQQTVDFTGGVLLCMAPGQVIAVPGAQSMPLRHTGWLLMIHPDLLWNTPLAGRMAQYDFFGYHVSEALHLSEKEECLIVDNLQQIAREYAGPLDRFSNNVMAAHLELLLTYAERFYQRQFVTREKLHHDVLTRLEAQLDSAFTDEALTSWGIPTVARMAEALHLSPNYLSRLLTSLTGRTTQDFLHERMIRRAQEKLSTTTASVSEIAYTLGFQHPQSFTKLFKSKTNQSPLDFRRSFN